MGGKGHAHEGRTYLRHVAHPLARHTGPFGARLAAQHPDLSRVEMPPADQAAEEGGLAASRSTQQSVAVDRTQGLSYYLLRKTSRYQQTRGVAILVRVEPLRQQPWAREEHSRCLPTRPDRGPVQLVVAL